MAQLQEKESKARAQYHEAVQKITKSKNTYCMEELLHNIGYGDTTLAHRCRTGFGITGETDLTTVFPLKSEKELIQGADPLEWLPRLALESRTLLKRKLNEQEVDDVLKDIYDTTTNAETGEVARGWATGPFTEKEMDELQGHKYWTASRRFGVMQGERTMPDGSKKPKMRQIDDLSEFMINACTTITEKVDVDGVDKIANMIKFWADLIAKAKRDPEGKIEIELSNQEKLKGVMHQDFMRRGVKLKGTCLDLEAAYKQCPIKPTDHHCAVFALKKPNDESHRILSHEFSPVRGGGGSARIQPGGNRLKCAHPLIRPSAMHQLLRRLHAGRPGGHHRRYEVLHQRTRRVNGLGVQS